MPSCAPLQGYADKKSKKNSKNVSPATKKSQTPAVKQSSSFHMSSPPAKKKTSTPKEKSRGILGDENE